jgi:multicomponent K+:H+ antiporter subunit E
MNRRRLLPFPFLSVVLWALWMLLVNELSLGHALLAAGLAIVLPLLCAPLWPDAPGAVRLRPLLRYLSVLLWDILTANFQVARWILGSPDKLTPAFFEVPVDLTHDFAITLLANTISLTPGTLTADVSADRSRLLIHSLHVEDIDAAVRLIKQRYEAPLKEMFAC